MGASLSTTALAKRFGAATVFEGIDLEVRRGELVGVVGPSGCGKSTLLRVLAGLEPASAGAIAYGGCMPPRIGLASQDPALFPWRTSVENVEYGLALERVPATVRREAAMALLAAFGLSGSEHRLPRELSGGMRQRVSLARALVTRPDLLLLDEPFSAVDDQTREALQDCLLQVRARRQVAGVFVTHSIPEAVHLCDRVLVLTSSPARLAGCVHIDLPYPRERSSCAASELERSVRAMLQAGNATRTRPMAEGGVSAIDRAS